MSEQWSPEQYQEYVKGRQKRSKFGSRRTVVDGIRFDSQKEADYYGQLKLRQKAGEVTFFLMQVPFQLPGGVKYLADFMEFKWTGPASWDIRIIDVKGMRTREYITKMKQVEELYGIRIEER